MICKEMEENSLFIFDSIRFLIGMVYHQTSKIETVDTIKYGCCEPFSFPDSTQTNICAKYYLKTTSPSNVMDVM